MRLKGSRDIQVIWEPATKNPVPYRTAGAERVVHHKTVTAGGTGASLYGKTGSWPQLTIGPGVIRQHYDTNVGGRALVNAAGGVETNSFGVIQLEIIGYPGVTMPARTADALVHALKQIQEEHGIPWAWPNGRPRPARDLGGGRLVDPGAHNRSTAGWRQHGHFGHANVPENSHWDPAYTDLEWFVLNQAMAPAATARVLDTWKVRPMFEPALDDIVDALHAPFGLGCWLLAADGAVFTTGKAPYQGGMNPGTKNAHHFVGRTAARLRPHEGRYLVEATSGESYDPLA